MSIKVFCDIADLKNIKKFNNNNFDTKIRNSKHTMIDTEHWIGGWLWYYIQKINRENFLYDLYDIDNSTIQYTRYDSGDFYDWHKDGDVDTCYKSNTIPSSGANLANDQVYSKGECVRKLSFSLQLSNEQDYKGGNLEFKTASYEPIVFAPKEQGTLIIFDSRVEHQVSKIESGTRKSIVGWVVGSRWK